MIINNENIIAKSKNDFKGNNSIFCVLSFFISFMIPIFFKASHPLIFLHFRRSNGYNDQYNIFNKKIPLKNKLFMTTYSKVKTKFSSF